MNALHFKLRDTRHPVALAGVVVRCDGHERAVAVEDLTLHGCCIEGDFRIGETVRLKLPQLGEFAGSIRWSMLGKAGIRFEATP